MAEFDEDLATGMLASMKVLRELRIHKRSLGDESDTVSSCEPSSLLCSVTEFVLLNPRCNREPRIKVMNSNNFNTPGFTVVCT